MAARSAILKWTIVVLVVVIVVGGVVATLPYTQPLVEGWFGGEKKPKEGQGADNSSSCALVRDGQGRPIQPYTLRLFPDAIKGLQITTEEVKPASNLVLPPQIGTLGYDTDRLYFVRPRFQGEVIELAKVKDYQGPSVPTPERWRERTIGPGDRIEKGKLIAVLWSKELGDRKVALVSALLDLWADEKTLQAQESIYKKGSLPEAKFRETKAKVEKDLAAVNAAESGLGISRLAAEEIETVRKEARAIQQRLERQQGGKPETSEQRLARIKEEVKKWARVEILAPASGVIVEKNTNLGDMADPSKDTPLFRIADLNKLVINANFNEEYLPILQPLMHNSTPGQVRWKIRVDAEPDIPPLDLPILRIAPSLDPNQHTALVIGRIDNPVKDKQLMDKYLLAGQFVTATMEVPPGPNLVDLPTNALNEVDGESLVFVQPDPDRPEFVLRRVVVVRRTKEVTQVRSKLTPQDLQASEEEVKQGRRPFETLQAGGPGKRGDVVLTRGVTELTEVLNTLIAKARTQK
jgi:cobalt-zinc-cadmium efflux system membrane fusion protein